jgi:hypothetical protein
MDRPPANNGGRVYRLAHLYATVAGAVLLGWWIAAVADLLPEGFSPVQRQTSHVVAEAVLGISLLAGSWLCSRGRACARPTLLAAFGGLLYATINVIGDFAENPVMTGILIVSALFTVTSLVLVASRRC